MSTHLRRIVMASLLRRRSLLLKLLLVFPTAWFLFVLLIGLQESKSSQSVKEDGAGAGVIDTAFRRAAAPAVRDDRDALPLKPPSDDKFNAIGAKTLEVPSGQRLEVKPDNRVSAKRAGGAVSISSKNRIVDDGKAVLVAPADLEVPGEMGKAVTLSKNLSTEVQQLVDKGWQSNAFNQYVSDMISVHRSLPDMRDSECKKPEKYLSNLPDASVIICFHNEAWTVLLRTFHSVIDRSPPEMLKEIILVDDASTLDHLKKQLDDYVSEYPKLKIIRSPQRVGLIRARLLGAAHATGKVLTYLDSHCECTPGWLEPLLDRIARNSTTVVCPVIDVIDDTTLEYAHRDASGTNVGGFDWNLQFNWHAIPEREKKRRQHPSDPVWSPTMAGGLFAIDRHYFEYLGTYDSGFDIWGGENLELSFKIWMCGGTLEIIPCSHVGHIFRKRSPYQWRSGVNVLKRNSIRLAEVWLDDYKQYYYQRIGFDLGDYGDVTTRKELRKQLHCHPFDWYLKNVYPELFVPGEAVASGEVRNYGEGGSTCLDSPARKQDLHKPVSMYPCHKQGGNQIHNLSTVGFNMCLTGAYEDDDSEKNEVTADVCVKGDDEQFWMLSKTGEIRRDEACLDYAGTDVILYPCHGSKGNQYWQYDDESHTLKHVNSKKCLEMGVDKVKVTMQPCDQNNLRQRWKFQNYKTTPVAAS